MGLYTKEEIIDGDFKEYKIEDVQEQAHEEIVQNANSMDFETEGPGTVTEPDGQQAMPEFMQEG